MAKSQREVKKTDIDPGLETMVALAQMTSLSARKPPPQELAQAWDSFFHSKRMKNEAVQDFQATLALQTFRYLQVAPLPDDSPPWIRKDPLKLALKVLAKLPKNVGEEHKLLARAIYDEIESRPSGRSVHEPAVNPSLVSLLCVLSHANASEEARGLLQEQFDKDSAAGHDKPGDPERARRRAINLARAWGFVIDGFAREGDEAGIRTSVEKMKQDRIPFNNAHQRAIVNFFAGRDDVPNTKYWYNQPLEAPAHDKEDDRMLWEVRHSQTYLEAIRLCMRKHDEGWGRTIVRDAMQDPDPGEQAWDAVFTWAAFMGKGVDEVDRMMTVMMERFPQRRPTTATINGLVEIAMERGDTYMAERFINLSERRNIPLDASTYILQIKYRLLSNDLEGAYAAYRQLQNQEVEANKDLPVINQLIRAMCKSKQYDFETVIHVVEDVNLRRVRFEPETVSALTILHLSRDELHDAIDLLKSHVFHFSVQERALIATALFDLCLSRSSSTTRAWDTYTILVQLFPETPRSQRTAVMDALFARRRPDMAIHVFNGMQGSSRPDVAATPDTYVAVLLGLAHSARTISLAPGALSAIIRADAGLDPDDDGLDVEGFGEGGQFGDSENELETLFASVTARLKLDPAVPAPPSTRLLTALMLAHTALGHPRRALECWAQVARSREGPSWPSLHAAFRACESAPFGDEEAVKIWRRLRRMDVELGPELWASYLGALVGNGALEEALDGLDTFAQERGGEPEVFV
ncbi:MAG: hypothetical protein M1821_002213 [Bathelium mastoideum]|nr:MAG: hypothetical protein M1821_002213 [Bathelium mastoideum]